jgi:putative oxidoreductase
MALGKLLVRLVVGGFFVGHGLQKLRGSFGGPGIEGVTGMMESLEMRPAKRNALAASYSELVGGAGIALGAGTPFAAAALIGTMVTAIRKVHITNGPWNAQGGYEYNAVLIAVVTALADDGPGPISLDAIFGKARWGFGWGLFALLAGAAGSTAAIEAGKRAPAPVSTDDPDKGATAESADASI